MQAHLDSETRTCVFVKGSIAAGARPCWIGDVRWVPGESPEGPTDGDDQTVMLEDKAGTSR